MTRHNSYTDLLIIGAGPAGLMAACWASQYAMTTRLIDQKSERTKAGHADGINSRTMEILDSFGVADVVMRQAVGNMDASYWGLDENTGHIRRIKCQPSQPQELSRFDQMLLNQGAIEQILIDYLHSKGRVHVERGRKAEDLELPDGSDQNGDDAFPVHVRVISANGEDGQSDNAEVIHARYVIACDGAQSWTSAQLNVDSDVWKTESTWGVMDIVPDTDFPDIRRACAIQSGDGGSMMVVPRENNLVRFYLQMNGGEGRSPNGPDKSEGSLEDLIDMAERALRPYKLAYKHCDWWSLYPIGRRLIKQYHVDRIFFAGDAAHTHSPKGGQGMNISMQDSYNLVWKIAAVITGSVDPAILETYQSERRPEAEQLMEFDTRLVYAYEEGSMEDGSEDGVEAVRDKYAGFMAGVAVTYSPSILVSNCESNTAVTRNIQLGKRLPSYLVVGQEDGCVVHLAQKLDSNGCWRLLIFSGDLHSPGIRDRLSRFAKEFSGRLNSQLGLQSTKISQVLETFLIHSSPRSSFDKSELLGLFHHFGTELGWDHAKTFADDPSYHGDTGQAYQQYGIDKQRGGLIVCRPDQHVGWTGDLEDVEGLEKYFSRFLIRRERA
ncbi:FAD binding domain-containing protein [Aspergillus pseudotamarii]|uniref:FAD binding domain-containing protein n=1 Tax=Aspergillus pseudotamarii TaxID=132259 RepID=A0A5N6T1N5_ASPPS|nr:FAD binding domain-containing protein [Aspergillus pseudotamarii]KAE8140144.1 FAD binding domain-containing protein [Aspergillus pseudotamarii]